MKTYTLYNKATGLPVLKNLSIEDVRHCMTSNMEVREDANMVKRYGGTCET